MTLEALVLCARAETNPRTRRQRSGSRRKRTKGALLRRCRKSVCRLSADRSDFASDQTWFGGAGPRRCGGYIAHKTIGVLLHSVSHFEDVHQGEPGETPQPQPGGDAATIRTAREQHSAGRLGAQPFRTEVGSLSEMIGVAPLLIHGVVLVPAARISTPTSRVADPPRAVR